VRVHLLVSAGALLVWGQISEAAFATLALSQGCTDYGLLMVVYRISVCRILIQGRKLCSLALDPCAGSRILLDCRKVLIV
jgi:hypothetical protein